MGTTATAIQGQSGVELCYVLAIEGYKYLLTDYPTLSAVTTAWSSTIWADALQGLQVKGDLSQHLKPWSNEPSVPTMTFSVMGDNSDDQFATDVFKSKPTNRSELTVGFDTGDSSGGGFNISVVDADRFSTATHVYSGTEAFLVNGTPAGTAIAVATNGEGYFHPFTGNVGSSHRIPQPHNLPPNVNVNTFDSNAPVWISDSPTNWVGKTVGLWVHRVVAGVLDVKTEAECWFAGKISEVAETETGVDLVCAGIQQSIIDAEILADQWVGRLAEGYVFDGTEQFRIYFHDITSSPPTTSKSALFTTTGRLTADELCSQLAEFLDADATVGNSGSGVALRWSAGVQPTQNGPRVTITASQDTATADRFAAVYIGCNNIAAMSFLGWDVISEDSDEGSINARGPHSTGDEWSLVGSSAPFRYAPIGGTRNTMQVVTSLELEGSDGTFFDQTSLMPPQVQELVSGDSWGLFSIGDSTLFVGRKASATTITGITFDIGLPGISLNTGESLNGLRIGDGRSLRVKQCLFIAGSFSDIMAKLFASIDGNGANHATYDVFPFGASIPWGLLGDNFINSLGRVEQASAEDAISIIVEKPMKLWDVIKSDFALRFAAPIWKDGGIQIAQLTTPNASTADFTLDHTNFGDTRNTVPKQTSEYQVHTLKIAYNRTIPKDKYLDEYIVRDQAGYEHSGKHGKTKTIKARNSYGGIVGTGASVEALGDMISSRFMPVFSRPLKTWTRSINHNLFHMCPGDTVSISDDRVRNPTTGKRGITSRAAVVISVSHSLGISSGGQGYHGEVTLLYSEEDRLFGLSPSCESAPVSSTETGRNWTTGYDDEVGTGGVFSLLVHGNKFTDSILASDTDYFAAGDAIRITEVDPSGTADSFTDTIASITQNVTTVSAVDYDEIVLTTGFGNGGNPAYDTAKLYYVNSDIYTSASAAQKLYAYQADDTTGDILGTIDPNLCGDKLQLNGSTTADLTLLPARYSAQQYGDGVPLSASFLRDQVRNANNLVNYKCATHSPWADDTGGIAVGSTASMYHIATRPYLLENGLWMGGRKRMLNVAPQYCSTSGTSATVTITLSAQPPTLSLDGSGFALATFQAGPTSSASWSTTSATQYTVGSTSQLLPIRALDDSSMTWITIEINGYCTFQAMAECWLGPLE